MGGYASFGVDRDWKFWAVCQQSSARQEQSDKRCLDQYLLRPVFGSTITVVLGESFAEPTGGSSYLCSIGSFGRRILGPQLNRTDRGLMDGSWVEILHCGRLGGMVDCTREPGLDNESDWGYRCESFNEVVPSPIPCELKVEHGFVSWQLKASNFPEVYAHSQRKHAT